jgi:hypothetical protein|tara:strand:+ start:1212 stop:1463 length:252 start_codon:yes stop_codon:yes gene_type:complete
MNAILNMVADYHLDSLFGAVRYVPRLGMLGLVLLDMMLNVGIAKQEIVSYSQLVEELTIELEKELLDLTIIRMNQRQDLKQRD